MMIGDGPGTELCVLSGAGQEMAIVWARFFGSSPKGSTANGVFFSEGGDWFRGTVANWRSSKSRLGTSLTELVD